MHFLHPAWLFGAALAAPVVLAHLLGPKQRVIVLFAPLFLLPRQSTPSGGRRGPQHLLLLLTRVAFVVSLALLCAHPASFVPKPDGAPQQNGVTAILVVDASASMNYRLGGRTLLQRAEQMVLEHMAQTPAHHALGLLVVGPKGAHSLPPTTDRALLREALAVQLPARGSGTADLGRALLQAQDTLRDALGHTQVEVFSDMARNTLPSGPPSGALDAAAPKVLWHDVAGRKSAPDGLLPALDNVAVTGLRALAGHNIEVTLRNFGPSQVAGRWLTVAVRGERAERGVVALPPHGTTRKRFALGSAQQGAVEVLAQLEAPTAQDPVDGYGTDDTLAAALTLAPPTRVLAVDGAPHSQMRASELFYVERALAQVSQDAAGIAVQVVARHELAKYAGQPWDVIVLANVGRLTQEEAAVLQQASAKGVGLVVALGDNIVLAQDQDASAYSTFLPFELRDAAQNDGRGTLGSLDRDHPILAGLGQAAFNALQRSRAQKYIFVAARNNQNAKVVMAYDDGAPALIEAAAGPGRGAVLLWTSSLDADWTDVPMMGVFVPLMQRLVRHAAPNGQGLGPENGARIEEPGASQRMEESDFTPLDPKLLAQHGAAPPGVGTGVGTDRGGGPRVATWVGALMLLLAVMEQLLTVGHGRLGWSMSGVSKKGPPERANAA